MESAATCRLRMDDGMLLGQRIDAAKDDHTRYGTVGLMDLVGYIADDKNTAVNEANTGIGIVIAGEKILFDHLLGRGSAMKAKAAADGAPGEFVKDAMKKLTDLRTEAELYANYQAETPGTQDYDNNLNRIADDAQAAIDTIFDRRPANLLAPTTSEVSAGLPREAAGTTTSALQAIDTVRALTRLIDALSSQAAFVEATDKGGNGVFEDAMGKALAEKAYSANKSMYEVLFGTTGTTRYGAITMMSRVGDDPDVADDGTVTAKVDVNAPAAARYDMRFWFDGFDTDDDDNGTIENTEQNGREDVGRLGAFAYSTTGETAQANQLYQGMMSIDVNFRRRSVFGRVSGLKDKDGSLWQYLDRDVSEIYLPRRFYDALGRFGGMDDSDTVNTEGVMNNDGAGDATIVYSDTHGFPLPTANETSARFSGRFIGADGAEIAGVWSLGEAHVDRAAARDDDSDGNDETPDDARDIIYGSFGVERVGDRPLPGETGNDDASSGGANQARLVGGTDATYAGTRTAGILRLGKYRTGGDANNDFKLTDIFAAPGAEAPKASNSNPNTKTHVAIVVDFIQKQREIYEVYTTLEADSDDATSVSNMGRQRVWIGIINKVRSDIFGLAALTTPTDSDTDNDLRDEAGVPALDLQSPLGSIIFPGTRTGNPDDDAALQRIQALLDALSSQDALEAALADNGGGVFDSMPHLRADTARTDRDRPFPMRVIGATEADDGAVRTVANIFTARGSQTKLWSLSTNYTRFGVWFRQEQASGVAAPARHSNPTKVQLGLAETGDSDADDPAGAESPNSYAYSWLNQSSYRRDRVEQTYPSEGVATYTGHTLAVLDDRIFKGDAEVKVTWAAVPATGDPASHVLPKFSNFRQIGNEDPLRLGSRAQNNNEAGVGVAPIVDEISFLATGGDNMMVNHSAANGNLGVEYTATGAAIARITHPTSATVVDRANATFSAVFVGESLDGPLGIAGMWSIPDFNGTTNDNRNNDLFGAFGADLNQFETLFRP